MKPKNKETTESALQQRQQARSRTFMWFYIVSLAALSLGAILLCVFVFFRVGSVQVTGCELYDPQDVLAVCQIQQGDNLVLLSTVDREAAIEHRFPYVEKAEIRKQIPAGVEICLTMAEPAYSVQVKEGYLYVSQEGKILEQSTSPCVGSAVILGGEVSVSAPCEQLVFAQEAANELFAAIREQVKSSGVEGISKIDFSNRYDITMQYRDHITFLVGNSNAIDYKLKFGFEVLHQMQETGEVTEDTYGEIDLECVPDQNKAFFKETTAPSEEEVAYGDGEAGRSPDAVTNTP